MNPQPHPDEFGCRTVSCQSVTLAPVGKTMARALRGVSERFFPHD